MADWPLYQGGNVLDAIQGVDGGGELWYTEVPHGAIHTKGSWKQIIASIPRNWDGVVLRFHSQGYYRYMVDLGIGPLGEEVVVVPDIPWQAYTHEILGGFLPVSLPAGQRLAMRLQNSNGGGGSGLRGIVTGVGATQRTLTGYNRMERFGVVPASTQLTTLTGDDTTAAAWGAWVEMGTTTFPWNLMEIHTMNPTTAFAWMEIEIGVGAMGSEVVLLDNYFRTRLSGLNLSIESPYQWPVSLPEGTRIAARVRANGTTTIDIQCSVGGYG